MMKDLSRTSRFKKSIMLRTFRIGLHVTILVVFMFISMGVFAQDPEDPSSNDPAVPLDGGISLLLAAGAALGGRKLFVRSRESKD